MFTLLLDRRHTRMDGWVALANVLRCAKGILVRRAISCCSTRHLPKALWKHHQLDSVCQALVSTVLENWFQVWLQLCWPQRFENVFFHCKDNPIRTNCPSREMSSQLECPSPLESFYNCYNCYNCCCQLKSWNSNCLQRNDTRFRHDKRAINVALLVTESEITDCTVTALRRISEGMQLSRVGVGIVP